MLDSKISIMRLRYLISVIILVVISQVAYTQVYKSKKSFFKPEKKTVAIVNNDKAAPDLIILSPSISADSSYNTDVADIDLVGRVSAESGISTVLIDSKPVEVTETGLFTKELFLYKGINTVTIVVVDNNNNVLNRKLDLNYEPPVLTFAEKVNATSKYYGLIIGIDDYQDPLIKDLDNPIRDARKLYDVLVNDYTFEKENVKLLEDATRADLIETLDLLSRRVTGADNLLIFYAGHGWWDPDASNGYWLPSDARKDSKTAWFRNSTLVDYLKEVKSKHTLLITDACFGGAIFRAWDAFPGESKAVEALYRLPSRKAMTSGNLTEVPDKSAFTRFLIDRLKSNHKQYLSSEQLFSSFKIAVINNSDAIPQYGEIKNVGDQGGDFIFIKRTNK